MYSLYKENKFKKINISYVVGLTVTLQKITPKACERDLIWKKGTIKDHGMKSSDLGWVPNPMTYVLI